MVLMTAAGEVNSRLQYLAARSESTPFHPRILKGCSFNPDGDGPEQKLEKGRAILPSKTGPNEVRTKRLSWQNISASDI